MLPVISDDNEKEKKRPFWPWIVGGCVVIAAAIAGFIILCGILFEFCKGFGELGF